MERAYFTRLAMAPAIVDVETRRMASRSVCLYVCLLVCLTLRKLYAKQRISAGPNALVQRDVKDIVGAPVCLPACLSACLPVCLLAFLPVCLLVVLLACLLAHFACCRCGYAKEDREDIPDDRLL
jgi:hypothetical protein